MTKMVNNLLSGTGGSTKGIGMYRFMKSAIQNGFKPDVITGVSVTALIGVPLALGKFDALDEVFDNFDLNYIFNKKPVNDDGKITFNAYCRVVFGKESFGEMRNIIDVLAGLVSPKDFEKYKQGQYADVYVGAVDYVTGKPTYTNLKEQTYEGFLQWVLASSSIPVFTEPVYMGDKVLFDGGVRNHTISAWAIETFKPKQALTIYSRPQEYTVERSGWKPCNVLDVLDRTIEIMNVEISKNDEFEEQEKAEETGTHLVQAFLPKVLHSLYDVNRERLNILGEEGEKEFNRIQNKLI